MSLFKKSSIASDYAKYRNLSYVPLQPVTRKKNLSEADRREYATELIDTYNGFGLSYLIEDISQSFSVSSVKDRMIELAYALPLLEKFIRTISKVYTINPTRKFYQDGKEIIDELPNDIVDPKKYIINPTLFNTLNDLYNDSVNISLKEIEKLTNLLNAVPVKVVTDINKKIKLLTIPNDNVQVFEEKEDITIARDIIFINEKFDINGKVLTEPEEEVWSGEFSILNNEKGNVIQTVNKAGVEAKKLYGNNQIGWAFAPFVIFRNSQPTMNFWDVKGKDLIDYISSINISLTELRYLTRYTAFDLKYTVNLKTPKDGIADPMGVLQFAIDSSGVPGGEGEKNWDIGELKNHGSIKEVIESIIFNLKMIYDIFDINLDSLITTNSVRSAESKDKDKENLFDWVNSQREIWQLNEQNFFKVASAVHNRDVMETDKKGLITVQNGVKIPKGIEIQVNFEELDTTIKTNEDWMTEINNDISSFIDWLSAMNPDLDRDELMKLLEDNRGINALKKEEKDDDNINDKKENG